MSTPKLRFKDGEEWLKYTLGDVSEIKTGPFGSTLHADDYVEEGTPIVTTEHFKDGFLPLTKEGIPQVSDKDLNRLSAYILNTDDIVFSRVGSIDINALVTATQNGWLFSGRVLRVRPDKNIDSAYLHYELSTRRVKKDIADRAVGQTMPSINTEILKETTIFIPCNIEQQKIALFFSTLDQIISDCQSEVDAWEQQKKGVMQQLFSQKIRFKDDDGSEYPEWGKLRADELFENIVDKGHPCETVLTIVQGQGTVPRSESGRNIQYDKDYLSSYKKVKTNDFIIHLRSFEGGLEMANEEGIVSPAYIILRSRKQIAPYFYYAYFHTNEFIDHNLSKTVEGIRDGRQISYQGFKKLELPWCSYSEQQKIASCLSTFDEVIDKSKKELEKYQELKKGLMQQMFV